MKQEVKMRPLTSREKVELAIILTFAIWMMLAAVQGIAFLVFGMGSGKAFLGSLAFGPPLAIAWVWTTGDQTEIDGTDEAGA